MEPEGPASRPPVGLFVLFEVLLWASVAAQAVGGIVAPLAGLAHQGDQPGTTGDMIRISGGGNRMDLPLTDEGIKAVFGPGAELPASGTVSVGDVYLTPGVTAQVTPIHPGFADVMASVGTAVAGSVVLIAAFVITLMIVRTARRGDPFDPRNIKRLKALALTLIAGWLAVTALHMAASMAAASGPALERLVNWQAEITLAPLIIGLGLAMLTAVFQRGARLREDTKGLV
jgi:hypothetical protein